MECFGFLLVPATRRPCDLRPPPQKKHDAPSLPLDPDLRRPMFPNLHRDCDSAAARSTEKNRVDDIDTVKLSCTAMKENKERNTENRNENGMEGHDALNSWREIPV